MDNNVTSEQSVVLDQLHITIDSHVVVQLGAELVSDAEQALIELVKNSYDADSPNCSIKVETDYSEDVEGELDEDKDHRLPGEPEPSTEGSDSSENKKGKLNGKVTVEDAGDGMTFDQIQRGWLVISASQKRPIGSGKKKLTKKYLRVPLGDKGLGRLSTMRLGDKLTIKTWTEHQEQGIELSFRWSSFKTGTPIEEVTLEKKLIEKGPGRKKGTVIEIVGLNEINHWRESSRRHTLRTNLSALVSPFEHNGNFIINLLYDGDPYVIDKLSQEELDRAAVRFDVTWGPSPINRAEERKELGFQGLGGENDVSANKLFLTATIHPRLFQGNSRKSFSQYAEYIESDKGAALRDYFNISSETRGLGIVRRPEDGVLVIKEEFERAELPSEREYAFWADPGQFHGTLYYYLLNSEFESAAAASAGAGVAITKDRIKSMAGASIFRDGFKVRFGDDWLRLSHGATSGGSYYGLRPQNTIGYFNISGARNDGLIEKSDREGFVDNPDFRGFMTITRRSVKFANDTLEKLRRAASDYIKERERTFPPEVQFSPEDGVEKIEQVAARLSSAQKKLDAFVSSTHARFTQLREKANQARNDLLVDEKTQQFLTSFEANFASFQSELNRAREEIRASTDQVSVDMAIANQVGERFEALHEQIQKLYESAAVGLAARGLVHDASAFIDEIFSALKALRSKTLSIDNGAAYKQQLMRIQVAAKGIANYLALIDPMLPAQRMQREVINLGEYVTRYFDVRKNRFNEQGIEVRISNNELAPRIKVNRGRLLQVIDNLVRNSEYWIMVASKGDKSVDRRISIDFSNTGVTIFDSGRGVRQSLEHSLFELFVSDKPEGEASGIGLFIARTLLEFDQCAIELLPERNAYGRRYKFFVNFSSVKV